jgi:catechol 2,3-dioxygenase-like lactoylglutathione lyase family enzyme
VRFGHLALAVADEGRSRRFYERWFGFGARPPYRYPDGVLMLYAADGFSLALGPHEPEARVPAFLHFGFALDDPGAVRDVGRRMAAEGIEVVEGWDEPAYVSIKVRDPDGYVIEIFWELPPDDGDVPGA